MRPASTGGGCVEATVSSRSWLAAAAVLAVVFITVEFCRPANAACTLIRTVNQLQAIKDNPGGDYCLARDIDAGSEPNFTPIGRLADGMFTGHFDGRGFAIRNLRIDSSETAVGLFAVTDNAVITNVNLLNIQVVGSGGAASVGGLVGQAYNSVTTTIRGVHVSGSVYCSGDNCNAGGIIGFAWGDQLLSRASSAATVSADGSAGGAIGLLLGPTRVIRTNVTGAVHCLAPMHCIAGGLIGRSSGGVILLSSASGMVTGSDGSGSRTGGLIGLTESGTTVSGAFALGAVRAGSGGYAAGLIAANNSTGAVTQVYSAGPVSGTGATLGGLIATSGSTPSAISAYWDAQTSGQASSAGGAGLTTAQMRVSLSPSFGGSWGITPRRSYPFFNLVGKDFAAPLATVVAFNRPFVFLPINQREDFEYKIAPAHARDASLAAVYTMIARSVGINNGDSRLVDVKIDRFFWNDVTRRSVWRGPVRLYARLGRLLRIPAGTPLNNANVIRSINQRKPVILRGSYRRANGTLGTHWMLATLYTQNSSRAVNAIIANDPFTGRQVRINPVTKRVMSSGFPLKTFRVNGYRPVTLIQPPP
jgi:hypothetical protein